MIEKEHRSLEKSISGKGSEVTDAKERDWRNLKIKEERRELLPPELRRGIPSIFVGCRFECSYCKPSYQRNMKRQKRNCELCGNFEPRIHLDRIRRI